MYLRYSSRVVAPMHCSSPRARAGFRRLAASMPPPSSPLPPEPTSVCTSSMTRMTRRLLSETSLMTARSRSSKSPRRPVPASMAPMSSDQSSLQRRSCGGTRPSAMRCATASATAVLPTPGGPTRQALFFLLRRRICTTRSSSSSRPTTGSSAPSRASCVKFVATSSSVSFFLSSPPAPPASASCLPASLDSALMASASLSAPTPRSSRT
mmetsp:Transcript_58066/g.165316  ORF Transcript_58066/g.165316 Transcript_58066/m.165316 type:complete len:210 (-) Transcript_58066:502-1131(-)